MKTAFFDCFSGISGDMACGALIDAGADLGAIQEALSSLNIPGFKIEAKEILKKDVMATQFRVIEDEKEKHPHRHLSQIKEIISDASLPDTVKEKILETFQLLGEAEAAVHGMPVEKIHFHEVGAVDSIVDIVTAQYAMYLLEIETVYATPLHVGAGTVKCAHGIMPVPAPATARLLKGIPTYGGAVEAELVTPTGAAILKQCCLGFGHMPEMAVDSIGYGSGEKHLMDRANVLRVSIGESTGGSAQQETVTVIECMIDDMNPELFPVLTETLLEAGARDVYLTSTLGKKGRAGFHLTVLCDRNRLDTCSEIIFTNSSTSGMRYRDESRKILPREIRKVKTPWGTVEVKVTFRNNSAHHSAPEYESCKIIAQKEKIATKSVYEAALAAALRGEWINE